MQNFERGAFNKASARSDPQKSITTPAVSGTREIRREPTAPTELLPGGRSAKHLPQGDTHEVPFDKPAEVVSLNATEADAKQEPTKMAPTTEQPLQKLGARYRAAISRSEEELYSILEDTVIEARRMHAQPSLWAESGVAAPQSQVFKAHLEAVLRYMAPQHRGGRQRASKDLRALCVLVDDGVADHAIAVQLDQRGGIERLAYEFARRNRGESTEKETSRLSTKIELPPTAKNDDRLVVICRVKVGLGERARIFAERIIGPPLSVTTDELTRYLSACSIGEPK